MDVQFDMSQLIREFDDMADNLKNLPLLQIGALLKKDIENQIESEGKGSWQRFSPATLRRHPRRKGGKLLQDTGLLANIQVDTGQDWVMAGSDAEYGKYHVTGTRKMPKRDFIDIDMDAFYRGASDLILTDVVR